MFEVLWGFISLRLRGLGVRGLGARLNSFGIWSPQPSKSLESLGSLFAQRFVGIYLKTLA